MFKKIKHISKLSTIVISIIIYIAGVTIYSIWSYYSHKNEILEQVDKKLFEAANSVNYLLPNNYHDRAIAPDSITKIEFFEITDLLSKQNDNLGVKYTYSVVLHNGKIYFTTSSATSEELLTGNNLTYYWQEYTEADTLFYNAFNSSDITYLTYTDRWGTFRSVLIPVTTKLGNKYLACADMEISFIRKMLLSEIPTTIFNAIFLLLLVIPFIITMLKNYRKYSDELEREVKHRTTALEEEMRKRKLSEEILRQSEEKFSISFNRTPVPMFIIDSNGIIVDVNESFEKTICIKKIKIIGTNILLIPFFQSAADYEYIKTTILTKGSILNFQMKFLKNNGTGVCSFSGELINVNKKPNILSIVFDLSDRQKYENELKIAKEKAEENDRLKSAFLANMSHEVRTPLNVIIGFSDLIRDEELDKKTRNEYINMITSSSHSLLNLINDIIDISKIEAGQLRISETACNLNQILNKLLQLIEKDKFIKGKGNLEINLLTSLSNAESYVLVDEGRLKQVFVNLLTNALKFTLKGKIEFGYIINNNEIKFYVYDSGIGINKDSIERIFERFKQADDGTSLKYGGTGLGLAISKAIVNLLGGDIWVESELEKGSKFYFTMPYKQLKDNSFKNEDDTKKTEFEINLTNRTILIVEDDDASFLYLRTLLEKKGANVLHVEDGDEAIEITKTNTQIDLILMDLHLPITSGCKATQEIHKFLPNVPIIAQTADAQLETREHAFKCGFDDFITKPLSSKTLFSVIKHFLK
ncbi:MAG: hypothetical protein A2X08_11750 [Bacteroidetes bacterium GWA2_32_17]|nr:MAG: hypothetical protein A2X08_11750 [Bacteroidetes bacterium GWA2_32_17]